MGTKQIRISQPDQIRKQIGEFQGKKINIVLHNTNVFLGTLVAVVESGITIVNMRQKEVSFMLTEINEIYFDSKV